MARNSKAAEIIKIKTNEGIVNAKHCSRCNILKSLSQFNKHKGGVGDTSSQCKKCRKIYTKQYRHKNKEKIKEYKKRHNKETEKERKEWQKKYYVQNIEKIKVYRKQNSEKHKIYMKNYYNENKDYLLVENKRWYMLNKNYILQKNKERYEAKKEIILKKQRIYRKQYYKNNKKKIAIYHKKYRKENKEVQRACKLRRRARVNNLPNIFSQEDFILVKDYFGGKCCFTNSNKFDMDHFIPISIGHGGTYIGNMIPLSPELNYSKNNKNPFEWIKTREDIDIHKFSKIVKYLANLNGLSPEEYKEFVYWCFENPRTIEQIKADGDKTSLDIWKESLLVNT